MRRPGARDDAPQPPLEDARFALPREFFASAAAAERARGRPSTVAAGALADTRERFGVGGAGAALAAGWRPRKKRRLRPPSRCESISSAFLGDDEDEGRHRRRGRWGRRGAPAVGRAAEAGPKTTSTARPRRRIRRRRGRRARRSAGATTSRGGGADAKLRDPPPARRRARHDAAARRLGVGRVGRARPRSRVRACLPRAPTRRRRRRRRRAARRRSRRRTNLR